MSTLEGNSGESYEWKSQGDSSVSSSSVNMCGRKQTAGGIHRTLLEALWLQFCTPRSAELVWGTITPHACFQGFLPSASPRSPHVCVTLLLKPKLTLSG